MKRSLSLSLACLIAALSLCGCFKIKEDFTVNPDGSGKVTGEMQALLPKMGEPTDAAGRARQLARRIVNQSEGVTAWKDMVCSSAEAGKSSLKGTAYFKDISKLKFAEDNTSIRWTPAADGSVQLEFVWDMGQEPPPKAAPQLTEEEIKKKIAEARTQLRHQISMTEQVLGEDQREWTFTLPGTVVKCVNFQPVAGKPDTVRLVFEDRKMVEFLKSLSEDEAALRAKIVAGKDPVGPPDPDVRNEKLFGEKGPIMVTFKPGGKPLFDWAAESAAAKEGMPEIKAQLEKPLPPAPAPEPK